MKIITDDIRVGKIPELVASIGCFDGMHRGHLYLIRQLNKEASARQMRSALITFTVHPRTVIDSGYVPELLTSLPEKIDQIDHTNIDYCILMPFTKELSNLTAKQFMHLLQRKYNVRSLLIGYDHRFGHNRLEGFEDYLEYGKSLGIRVLRADGLVEGGHSVSSSLIRKYLKSGDIESANRYLGYNYCLTGIVEDGFKIGRKLGFPTANLHLSCEGKLIPARGVYAAYVNVAGQRYLCIVNIGYRPTFSDGKDLTIEINILNFSDNIYRCPIKLELVEYIRAEHRFETPDELIKQIEKDVIKARKILR